MLLDTLCGPLQKFLKTADSTDTSFPSKIPTLTEPVGNGVLELGQFGAVSQNGVVLLPYATAGNNDTFSIRLIGWRKIGTAPDVAMWIPVVLCELACICCAATGVTGGAILATERFVDSLTIVTGNANVSIDVVSPLGDVIAHAVADTKGCQKIEATFDSTAAGATAMNCLVALV